MDINSLRSFVLFSEFGSLNKVATAQHRTNAAISAQMKKLSDTYNIQLFEKSGRNLELSSEGKSFLDVAKCILSLHDKVIADIKNDDLITTISIEVPSDYAGSYLLKLIDSLTKSFKRIKFDLTIISSKELFALWQKNKLDITVYSAENSYNEGSTITEIQGHWMANLNYELPINAPINLVLFDNSCLFHQ